MENHCQNKKTQGPPVLFQFCMGGQPQMSKQSLTLWLQGNVKGWPKSLGIKHVGAMNGDHVLNSLVHHVISLDVPLWIKAMDWLKIKGKRVSDSYRPGCSGVGMDWLQPMGCRWDSSSPPKISSYSLPKHQEAVCNGPSPWASASIYFRNRAVISKPQSHVLRISADYALFTPYPTNLAGGPMRPIPSEVVNFLKRRKKKRLPSITLDSVSPGSLWVHDLRHPGDGRCWDHVWPEEELLRHRGWWPAVRLHNSPRTWWGSRSMLSL